MKTMKRVFGNILQDKTNKLRDVLYALQYPRKSCLDVLTAFESSSVYTVNYKAKATIVRGALPKGWKWQKKSRMHASQTKCDFRRNLDGCITPFASEARLDCKLQGWIPKSSKRTDSEEGTMAQVRSLSSKAAAKGVTTTNGRCWRTHRSTSTRRSETAKLGVLRRRDEQTHFRYINHNYY